MNTRVLWPEKLSDSLLLLNRAFFKRHTFFVIITRGDSCYFYKAKGEYMYKNFSAEGAN